MPKTVPSVSIVVPTNGDFTALDKTLNSLKNQKFGPAEVKIAVDSNFASSDEISAAVTQKGELNIHFLEAAGLANARNLGVQEASADFVVFLDSGDRLPPAALIAWSQRLKRNCAEVGFSRFKLASSNDVHSGMHDRNNLGNYVFEKEGFVPLGGEWVYIHAHPSAKIFSRELVEAHNIRFLENPLSSWVFFAQALSSAKRAIYLENLFPVIGSAEQYRSIWKAPANLTDLLSGVKAALKRSGSGSENNLMFSRLLSRAVWEKANFANYKSEVDRKNFLNDVENFLKSQQLKETDFDPYVGARIKVLFDQ